MRKQNVNAPCATEMYAFPWRESLHPDKILQDSQR